MDLESFELVFLRRPPDAPPYDEATLTRLQAEHLAFYDSLRASGEVATNGPTLEPADPWLRGLAFYRTGSVHRARTLAEQDPLVLAGRLVVEVTPWWCRAGTMVRPGTPVPLEEQA